MLFSSPLSASFSDYTVRDYVVPFYLFGKFRVVLICTASLLSFSSKVGQDTQVCVYRSELFRGLDHFRCR